ncbi:hypothetical protein TUM20985_40820 [Mycobacterium antarcticum]|nr:hypothetical protein TUM20985_40820 [Mycolicibacterium sp. TUM20985]GLP76711.1 hypothetical protein TUM20983_38210 [Mycolicibacterium sp. TUM20983]GLP82852.1 hypothetical protein TUM20984_42720 [Mycolicibacterium sp. TUM20984]
MAVAAVFVWLGMVLAISFVEAPLKFRAPGVTLKVGLGIGRLVFRALNVFEYVFVLVIAVALFTHETSAALNIAVCVAVGALLTQTIAVRPLLARRTAAVLEGDAPDGATPANAVLVGEAGRRSRAHFAYVGLELVKVIALVWTGALLIGA